MRILLITLFIAVAVVAGIVFLRQQDPTPMPSASPTTSVSATPSPVASASPTPTEAQTKTFTVIGDSFTFSEKEIRVRKGDRVTIIFKNTEGLHDWVIDEFNVRTAKISAGKETTVEFTADKAGTFEYYCSVGTHRQMGMKGTLIVE